MTDLNNPYRQLPSETGGQPYHMECVFCHEWGNMYSSAPFVHTPDCPAGKAESDRMKPFGKYQAAIRYFFYKAKHGGWGLWGFLGTAGFLLLAIPYGLYYKITKKPYRDLELF